MVVRPQDVHSFKSLTRFAACMKPDVMSVRQFASSEPEWWLAAQGLKWPQVS